MEKGYENLSAIAIIVLIIGGLLGSLTSFVMLCVKMTIELSWSSWYIPVPLMIGLTPGAIIVIIVAMLIFKKELKVEKDYE